MNVCVTLFQFYYRNYLPPGGVYLAYGLESENIGFKVKPFSIDKFYAHDKKINTLYTFLENSEKIVCIGCYSDMLPYVLIALKRIKKIFPEKIIILGGIGPMMVAEEIMESFDFIDFVIKGCGIFSLPKLVKKIIAKETALDDIPGLLSQNKKYNLKQDFDISGSYIPKVPAYHRIGEIATFRQFGIKTSSGCPYQCTFCFARPATERVVTNRDTDEVIEEIKLIKKIMQGRDITIHIIDEAFVLNKVRVIKFCNLLKINKLKVAWTCYGRVDVMDQGMLENMRLAGCEEVYYGVESGSNRVLKMIKKGFSIEGAVEIALLTKKLSQELPFLSFIVIHLRH